MRQAIASLVGEVTKEAYLPRGQMDASHSITESLTRALQKARGQRQAAVGLLILPSIATRGFLRLDPYTGKLSEEGDFRNQLEQQVWETLYTFGSTTNQKPRGGEPV